MTDLRQHLEFLYGEDHAAYQIKPYPLNLYKIGEAIEF